MEITPAIRTIHLCESFNVGCEVHGGGAANLHLLGATTTGEYYERGLLHPHYDYERPRPGLESMIDPMNEDGDVPMPEGSGLGFDIDWAYIEDHRVT